LFSVNGITIRVIAQVMEFVDTTRYTDALLLLSLRATEVDGELVINSTSCISAAVLGDMTDMALIDHSKNSGNYVITDKGKLTLKYVKKPWNDKYIRTKPLVDHQSVIVPHSV